MKLFLQETGHTCACATARMLIEHFLGEELSEFEIEQAMGTDPEVGSSTQDLIDYIAQFGIQSELVQQSTIEELKSGDEIKLLLYMVYGFPHVGIISQTLETGFQMFDPCTGIHVLPFEKLETTWHTDENVKSFIKLKHERSISN